ncbi:RICIN domain-containing protein [Lysobacter sp. Hz 25]|uniref:RICIN domain-containing protein n=1 Tax=Lysobacter sp. Hz 25 TaxID=3383698 RepID=UPI0038D3D688
MRTLLYRSLILSSCFLLGGTVGGVAKGAGFCGGRNEIGILGVEADSTSATVTWAGSEQSCGRSHYNVAWAGGGGRMQREVPISRSTNTWLGERIRGAVYTVAMQACTSRTAAPSICGPWVSKKFVSCGTKGVPCGHPRLNAPEPMVITSGAGLCLDVHAPDQAKDGAKVQVWVCNGSPQQTWVVDEKVGAVISLAGKCLDVQAAKVGIDGTPVQMWDCNRQVQQRWQHKTRVRRAPSGGLFSPMALQNAGGKCLDVHAPDQFNNGAKVQIWSCNSEKQQRWQITPMR